MRKLLYFGLVFSCLGNVSFAQNEIDLLRFSQTATLGTSLSQSMAGAGGSMGGDFSGLSINPAGLGVYRSNEMHFTPLLHINANSIHYIDQTHTENKTKMNLGSFGIVFTDAAKGEEYNSRKWKTFNFAIGYTRLADFNNHTKLAGVNTKNSYTDVFSQSALNSNNFPNKLENDIPPYGYLGYQGFLLDNNYESLVPVQGGILQGKDVITKGGISEWNLNVAGNYEEKLLIGVNLGISSINYFSDILYSEEDVSNNSNNNFKYFDLNENRSLDAIGFNLKLGAIYNVNENFKIGLAAHTPTWYAVSEETDYSLYSHTEQYKQSIGADPNPETLVQPDLIYGFEYSMRTPFKLVLSPTITINKKAIITADYEYIAYNTMRYNMNDFPDYANALNNSIKDIFKAGHNIRLGAEVNLNNNYIRGGAGYYSSPNKETATFKGDRMDFAIGLGKRWNNFFVDLSYMHRVTNSNEFTYPLLVTGTTYYLSEAKLHHNLIGLTLGFKL